jgi:hypothetical protein
MRMLFRKYAMELEVTPFSDLRNRSLQVFDPQDNASMHASKQKDGLPLFSGSLSS